MPKLYISYPTSEDYYGSNATPEWIERSRELMTEYFESIGIEVIEQTPTLNGGIHSDDYHAFDAHAIGQAAWEYACERASGDVIEGASEDT